MISGTCLKNAIISGANNISKNRSHIDELNIFPVPDGDTGTNMSMTIMTTADTLKKVENNKSSDASNIAKITASSLLRGARGNSGVILSILFKGISKGLEGFSEINGQHIVNSLGIGVDLAYKSVMKPTEGTMLTVARVAYERGKIAAHFNNDIVHVWSEVCIGAREALKTTPDLLPVLKKAGVVDAGGKGLCLIFEGMLSVFKDGIIVSNDIGPLNIEKEDTFRSAASMFDEDIRFTYCTEFIVDKLPNCKSNPMKLRKYLESIGDCVVVVDDEDIIKTHVHTENPGKALQEGLKFGELLTVKVENMKEQHRRSIQAEREKSLKLDPVLEKKEPVSDVGFVAVATGDGIHLLFKDLGCEYVISGGQTMNPSIDQIVDAIMATPAKTVFVFPNNKNIIMAANQAVDLVEDRKVIVVPTKTVSQGISAMLAYNSNKTADQNFDIMMEAWPKVRTGQVTFASRGSEFGGFKIREGDILALDNGKLILKDKDPTEAAVRLSKHIINKENKFITIIYGEDINEQQANYVFDKVKNMVDDDADVTLIDGGQPIYHFIISAE